MMEQEIAAAVSWWSDQLCKPYQVHNTGDTFNDTFIDQVQTAMNLPALSEEHIDTFKRELTAALRGEIEKHIQDLERIGWTPEEIAEQPYHFGMDYDPKGALKIAVRKVSMSFAHHRFPMKTVMWIRQGHVNVRCGYGAETKEVPLPA